MNDELMIKLRLSNIRLYLYTKSIS